MSEDQELLARIAQVAGLSPPNGPRPIPSYHFDECPKSSSYLPQKGQINRHKNSQQVGAASGQYPSGVVRHSHLSRGRARSTRGYGHPNRSLVLSRGDGDTVMASPTISGPDSPSWVSKQGRHLQLINSSVYKNEAELRSRSNSRPGESSSGDDANKTPKPEPPRSKHEGSGHHVEVDGITFEVCDGGKTLVRTTGSRSALSQPHTLTLRADSDTSSIATPKKVVIAKVEFHRNNDGHLHRVAAPGFVLQPTSDTFLTQARNAQKGRPLCKRFSNTGIVASLLFFCVFHFAFSSLTIKLGQCPRGPRCAHAHNPAKVAICKDFLRSGKCSNGPHCDLSHECSYARVPACAHFQRGKCTKDDCRYAHVRVNPAAPVCRAFSTYGFCETGLLCQERHVFECPDYASSGKCPNKHCRLPHIDRAGALRQAASGEARSSSGSRSGSPLENTDTAMSNPSIEEAMIPLGTSQPSDRQLSSQEDFVRF